MKYSHKDIEKKWQTEWKKTDIYKTSINSKKPHFYNLFMFPYPSAEGLHAGHAFSSTGGDVYGRFHRMNGYEVFQPMGYDSFGIHSENYAIKVNETPQTMLKRTTKHFEMQLRSLGHGYDWSRTLTTSDPDYYKWTQWIFAELFRAGLAYRKEASVNWCPSCKTVLADEQVINGACERCGTLVEKKNLAQWFFRITNYSDQLLNNLSKIDWTEKVKQAQKNWIGKSEGLNINFPIVDTDSEVMTVWTRYWETTFGATFLVVSPEYLLSKLSENASVESVRFAQQRIQENKATRRDLTEKEGADTGIRVINPLTKEEIPVWVANYVLEGVGTGAVMGVAAHDQRDFEFAKKYNLPIVQVVSYPDKDIDSSVANGERSCEDSGTLVNSGDFNGLFSDGEGKDAIKSMLIEKGISSVSTNYHLRDWLISRQRYWGAPIPLVYCEHCAREKKGWLVSHPGTLHADCSDWDAYGWYAVETKDLPVLLPEIEDYKPKGDGRGPLSSYPEFYKTTCPECGNEATRETDVCDTFLDSSWYFLRYPSVNSDSSTKEAFDEGITKDWLPVNFYLGGAEHSVLHLMYARFMTMVLHDLKYIDFEEPFPKFYAHGLMIKDGAKMSKSRGNVVNPDTYIEKFGADAMRLYLMFMGPMDGSPDFRDTGIEGMERFIKRVWSLFTDKKEISPSAHVESKLNETIIKVTKDIKDFHFNTAIAAIMELVNAMKEETCTKEELSLLVLLLAPFAPHMTEELWQENLGNSNSVHIQEWPIADESKILSAHTIVAIQINGKLRGEIEVSADMLDNEEQVTTKAKEDAAIKKWLEGNTIRKTIYVKGRIVNFVI